jgi:serine/threonine protein kinase
MVFKAFDTHMNQEVAIKVMCQNEAQAINEIKILGKLNEITTDFIVKMYESFSFEIK